MPELVFVVAAEQANADSGTQTTKTHHDGGSNVDQFHEFLLELRTKRLS